MEAVIAILIVLGVLSGSGVLPEKSPKPASQEAHAPVVEPFESVVRPARGQHDPVYRDLTVPHGERTTNDVAGKTEAACDE
jgi:hypothetical protein